jgi:hypothetical protein
MTRLILSLLCFESLFACGWGGKNSNPDPPSTAEICKKAAEHSPSLQVGFGEEEFNILQDDTVVTPTTAGQGGHHIWTAIKATGLNPGQGSMVPDTGNSFDTGLNSIIAVGKDPVLLTVEVSFPGTESPSYPLAYDTFLEGDTQNATLSGITALVNAWAIVLVFEDQETAPAQLFVSIKDACGTVVNAREDFKMGLVDIPGFYETGYD